MESSGMVAPPTLDAMEGELGWEQVAACYRASQLLLVKNLVPSLRQQRQHPPPSKRRRRNSADEGADLQPQPPADREAQGGSWGHRGLADLFEQPHGRSQIEASWNIENGEDEEGLAACRVLGQRARPGGSWYVSFILQDASHGGNADDAALMAQVCGRLPVAEPPFFDAAQVQHSDCIWVFAGQNLHPAGEAMRGRPEHVDEVDHAGTWHVQHSGSKVWLLRPNAQAGWPSGSAAPRIAPPGGGEHFRVVVEQGDFLMINTRLWYHHTEIPTTHDAEDQLSLSYARDFFFGAKGDLRSDMTNVDGPVASRPIARGEWFHREVPICAVQSLQSRSDGYAACAYCHNPLLCAATAPPSAHLALANGWIKRLDLLRGGVRTSAGVQETTAEATVPHSGSFPCLPPLRRLVEAATDSSDGPAKAWLPTGAVPGVDEAGEAASGGGDDVCGGELFCNSQCRDSAWRDHQRLLSLSTTVEPARGGSEEAGRMCRAYVLHGLRLGHYETLWMVAQLLAAAVSKANRKEGKCVEGAAAVRTELKGILKMKRERMPHWWAVVAEEECVDEVEGAADDDDSGGDDDGVDSESGVPGPSATDEKCGVESYTVDIATTTAPLEQEPVTMQTSNDQQVT
jgi:hypothetical protein